jgi:hypothetical protein
MTNAEEIFRLAVKTFEELKIPYAVHWGMALNYWGRPRATGDIDFLALVTDAQIEQVADYARRRGWEPVKELDNRLNIYLPGTKLYLEVWLAESEFEKTVIERGVRKKIDDLEVAFASPEDMIILKLLRFTALDMEDIVSIMDKQGETLDCKYVFRWSSRLRRTYRRLLKCIKETAYKDFWEACLENR